MAEYHFKVLLVGDFKVGKSAILVRFCGDIFNETHISSTGANFREKKIKVAGGFINLQIWDSTAETTSTIHFTFYFGSKLVFVVYDITNKESWDRVPHWIQQVSKICSDATFVIVGNKNDLESERQIKVTENDIIKLQEQFPNQKIALHVEVSSKTGDGIDQLFFDCVTKRIEYEGILPLKSNKKNEEELINEKQDKSEEINEKQDKPEEINEKQDKSLVEELTAEQKEKLETLDELLKDGFIDNEEYERRKQSILDKK